VREVVSIWRMERKRETQEVWQKRIERLRAGDLTDTEFAAELGVNVHTLRAWKYRLSDSKAPKPAARPARKPTFVELPRPTATEGEAALEIIAGAGVRIRVPVGFDEATLLRVLSVVGRAG